MRGTLRLLGVTLGMLCTGAVLGAFVLAGWLLLSTQGARQLLAWLPQSEAFALTVDQLDGRVLGPLSLRGLRVQTPSLSVEIDAVRLEWSPAALLARRAQVGALTAGTVIVRVQETQDPPDERAPRVPELPLSVFVERLRVQQVQLYLPSTQGEPTPQRVDAIALDDFEWAGERLALARLSATQAGIGTLEAELRARLAAQRVQIEQLSLRSVDAAPMRVDAQGTVQLDAQDSALALQWSALRWPLQGEPQVWSREGALNLEGRPEALRAQAKFALGDRAQLEAHGKYANQQIDAQLGWSNLAWPLKGEPRIASERGTLKLQGQPESYAYALDAQLAAEGQRGTAQAQGSGSLQHLVLDRLQLAVARARIGGQGRVEWSPALRADADLRVKDLDPGLIAPDWPGRINGRVQARTTMQGEQPVVRFDVALKDSRLRAYTLALDARGVARGAVVELERAQLRTGRTRLDLQGRVTPPFAVAARLDSPDLASLWPGLRGRAQLKAELRGEARAPRVIAQGGAQELAHGELAIRELALDADLEQDGPWRLDLDLRELSGPTDMARAQARLRGRAAEHALDLSVNAEPGDARLALRGAYDVARRRWNGELMQGLLHPAGLAPWTLEEPAALSVGATRVQLEPACWRAPDSRVCAQAIREPARLRGAFRVEQFDFAYFRTLLPAGWTLSGGVDGSAMLEVRNGRLAEARADLSTAPIDVQRDGQTLLKAGRGQLQMEEVAGRVSAHARLPLQDGALAFTAQLAPGAADYASRALSAQLEVALADLGFLRLLSEEIQQVQGRLEGRMNLSGTLAQPRPQGEIRLREAQLKLLTPGIELSALEARVASDGSDQTLRLQASAQSGGGTLNVDGSATLSLPTRVALAIRGDNFQAANTAEARAWISPRLDVEMAEASIRVSGEVDVPRAQITPLDFDSGVAPSRDQVIVSEHAAADAPGRATPLHADVRLNLGEAVRFEGFGLKTRLTGSVRAIEQPGRAGSGRGEVRLVDGRYKAYGQDLDIVSGRLLFNGGPLTEPAVELRAKRKPREDVEVGVLVRGTLDEPEFQLYSTPAMPRERQLSWLVLGRSLEDGGSGDEKAMIANAALSLGLSGTDFLAQNLRGGLGLDEISIGSDPGDEAQAARFTIGKYLSPKLYVSYGVGLFQPGQVFKLLYELGRGFKFSTESGVHTGGDLLYTIER